MVVEQPRVSRMKNTSTTLIAPTAPTRRGEAAHHREPAGAIRGRSAASWGRHSDARSPHTSRRGHTRPLPLELGQGSASAGRVGVSPGDAWHLAQVTDWSLDQQQRDVVDLVYHPSC